LAEWTGVPEARFNDWPDEQREALEEAFAAQFAVVVTTWQPDEIMELLSPLAQLHDDIGP
jgi:hypothetical protein